MGKTGDNLMAHMKLATIDIGTNTALLLISEWIEGKLVEVFNATGFVRLGEGMDASGRVSDAALMRLRDVLSSHMVQIRDFGAQHTIVTGTSASRDASDAHRIRSLVTEITGADLTILSGDEEALVTFLGATAGLAPALTSGLPSGQLDEEVTVIDVGGGSTEYVQGVARADGEQLSFKHSLNMGSVRMTERFFSRQPAPLAEEVAARTALRKQFGEHLKGSKPTRLCVGASGTSRIIALLHTGVTELSDIVGPVSVPYSELVLWQERLIRMTYDEVFALHPTKMKGRADVLPAGVLILRELLQFTEAETLVVSPFGVRHGVAIRYFRESGT